MSTAEYYDRIPYTSYPYPETHPARIRAIAWLYGLAAPRLEQARVLEIGCSGGGNLIPMAAAHADARFVGCDISPRQIEQAAGIMRGLGLKNVELHAASITDLAATLGQFDYIVCHGVYSWVPPGVRDSILDFCRDHLAPDGVAFISYNTYPGWHTRRWTREMMLFHAKQFSDEKQRIAEARAFVRLVAESPTISSPGAAQLLKRELAEMEGKRDDYIAHEYLEQENEPVYFNEFMTLATARSLQYLADARLNGSAGEDGIAAIRPVLNQARKDILRLEQYLDFFRNRMFRRTLLCQGGILLDRDGAAGRLRTTRVASMLTPRGTDGAFAHPRGAGITVQQPLLRAALTRIRQVYPRSIPFDDLAADVRAQGVNADAQALDGLAADLLKFWMMNLLEVHWDEERFITTVSARPVAWPCARHNAALGAPIASMRHEVVALEAPQRRLLAMLDGTRTIGELVDSVATSGNERPAAEQFVNTTLAQLAQCAVLVG